MLDGDTTTSKVAFPSRRAEVALTVFQVAELAVIVFCTLAAVLLTNTMMDRGWRAIHQPKNLTFWEYSNSILKRIEPHFYLSATLFVVNIGLLVWLLRQKPASGPTYFQGFILLVNATSLFLFFASYMTLKGA